MKNLVVLATIVLLFSCEKPVEKSFSVDDLQITWSVIENLGGTYVNSWKISNTGVSTLPPTGWTLFYNHIVGVPVTGSISGSLKVTQISGTFYSITPTDAFSGLNPGESTSINLKCNGSGIKITDAPDGLYILFDEGNPEVIKNFTLGPFPPDELMRRSDQDNVPIPTAETRFMENENLSIIDLSENPRIIPPPKEIIRTNGKFEIGQNLTIGYGQGLENEAGLLKQKLETLGQSITLTSDLEAADIRLNIVHFNQAGTEQYNLNIGPESISIEGSDPSGVFYGTQSLISLWPLPGSSVQSIQYQSIKDQPGFKYRGMHIDASRNFHQPEAIKKVLDIMSFYKLNKLHFHLTNDEGWRLEIQDVPELTEVGAVRGHTVDETDHLLPAYGSGPFPHTPDNHGTGFYRREQFIDILKYAAARHIEVIPEINLPGHARAAIKSMSARAKRIEAEGSSEPDYLLHDPDDTSNYSSVQGYTDNVICPCQESVYRFIEKVVGEIVEIYQEAGVTLTTIHSGGDEVPQGIWEGSPLCQDFLEKNPQIEGINGLSEYFLKRYHAILSQQDLITAGWEEIAMHKVPADEGSQAMEILVPNPQLVDQNLLPYVWNSDWGTYDDLAYKLANLGYHVILCNANNLYFDFAYSKDPMEPGFYWAGLVDSRKPFEMVPLNILQTATTDKMGNPIDPEIFENHVKLTNAGTSNIVGIQAQLWSETIKGAEMLEYYLFPKMIGLAERAWAPDPEWAHLPKKSDRLAELDQAWNVFANTIAQRELERLDRLWNGVNYRVPLPGAVIEDGMLLANVAFPGLVIRYTLDGSEPNAGSTLYNGPVEAKKPVKLKAFTSTGKFSRTSELSY